MVVTASGIRDESISADLLSTTSTGPCNWDPVMWADGPWGYAELEPYGEYVCWLSK